MNLQIKLAIAAIILALLGAGIWGGYTHIKDIGYQEAQAECIKKQEEYQKAVDTRLAEITVGISNISGSLTTQNDNLTQDISAILARVKRVPTVVIKDGKCQPTETFVKDVNEAIVRANKK